MASINDTVRNTYSKYSNQFDGGHELMLNRAISSHQEAMSTNIGEKSKVGFIASAALGVAGIAAAVALNNVDIMMPAAGAAYVGMAASGAGFMAKNVLAKLVSKVSGYQDTIKEAMREYIAKNEGLNAYDKFNLFKNATPKTTHEIAKIVGNSIDTIESKTNKGQSWAYHEENTKLNYMLVSDKHKDFLQQARWNMPQDIADIKDKLKAVIDYRKDNAISAHFLTADVKDDYYRSISKSDKFPSKNDRAEMINDIIKKYAQEPNNNLSQNNESELSMA